MADTVTLDLPETEVIETETPDDPETEDVETTAETDGEEEAETEETLTAEEAEKRAQDAVAAAKAEWEAERENERYKAQVQEADRQISGQALASMRSLIEWATKEVDSGKTVAEVLQNVNPQVIGRWAESFASTISTREWVAREQLADQYRKAKAPDWRPAPEFERKLKAAERSRDPKQMFEMHFDMAYQMGAETEGKKMVAEALKAREAQGKKAVQTKNAKNESDTRANRERPITGSGGAAVRGRKFSTQLQADTAFANGEITLADIKRITSLGLPYS